MNDALRRIMSVQPTMKNAYERIQNMQKFGDRGMSERTIRSLTDCPFDYPERLLFMTEEQIASIPGVGKVALAEIRAYRALFGI